MALLVARGCTGLTLRELGEAAGGMDYGAVSMAVRRMEARARKKKEIRKAFTAYKEDVERGGFPGPEHCFKCSLTM